MVGAMEMLCEGDTEIHLVMSQPGLTLKMECDIDRDYIYSCARSAPAR